MYKEIEEALIEIGFTKDSKYFRKDGLSLKLHEGTELSEVFKYLIGFGSTVKVWEIKRALQIIDPLI